MKWRKKWQPSWNDGQNFWALFCPYDQLISPSDRQILHYFSIRVLIDHTATTPCNYSVAFSDRQLIYIFQLHGLKKKGSNNFISIIGFDLSLMHNRRLPLLSLMKDIISSSTATVPFTASNQMTFCNSTGTEKTFPFSSQVLLFVLQPSKLCPNF